jgi:hypothetical protein
MGEVTLDDPETTSGQTRVHAQHPHGPSSHRHSSRADTTGARDEQVFDQVPT